MKKIIKLLLYLLVFSLLISLTLLLDIYSSKNDITLATIEMSISNNDNYNLINQILKDINKKDLIKYIDYVDLRVTQNIENDVHNLIAFTVSLPEDKSFIALYKKNIDNTYSFFSLIDNLYYVNKFYFYNSFFIVEQTIDTSTNSNENKTIVEIFFNTNNLYVSVLTKDIYKEITDSENNKTVFSASIDFLGESAKTLIYVYSTSRGSINDSDLEDDMSVVKEFYEWNSDTCKFSLLDKEVLDNSK
ncbi:MAG: hypothetical protein ACRCXT_00335 [Paraclostridium sp.]